MADMVSLQSAVKQIYAQGGTDGDVQAFLKERGFKAVEGEPAAQQQSAARPDVRQMASDVIEPEIEARRKIAVVNPANLEVNPSAARLTGGMVGGTVAAAPGVATGPAAPLVILGGSALGAELGGQAAELWNKYVVGKPDPQTGLQRAVNAGSNILTDMAFGAGGAALAEIPGAVWRGVKEGVKSFFGGGTPEAAEALKSFRAANVTPTPGAVGGPAAKGTEQALRKMPTSAGIMDRQLDTVRKDLMKESDRVIRMYGEPVSEMATAGGGMQAGLRQTIANSDEYFEGAYKAIPGLRKASVDMDPVQQVAKQIVAEETKGMGDAAAIRVANRVMARTDGSLRGPGIDFDEAIKLRSDLLKAGRTQDAEVAGAAESAAQRLAGALDDAMQTGATKAANAGKMTPSDYTRWRQTNAEYAEYRKRLDQVGQIARSDTAENAFKAAMAGANDGPTRLAALKQMIPEQDWDRLVTYKLGEMRLETPGGAGTQAGAGVQRDFSWDRFLTNWRAIKSDASKDLLFGAPGDPRRDALDNLMEVVSRLKGGNAFANPSGTTGARQFSDLLSGASAAGGASLMATGVAMGHPAPIALGAMELAAQFGGPYVTARLMNSPKFVNWLATAAQIKPTDWAGLGLHTGRLVGIVKAEPELREAMQNYVDGMQLLTPSRGDWRKKPTESAGKSKESKERKPK